MANKRNPFEEDSGANLSGAMGISEHTVIRVMAGEVEALRPRLAGALEQLKYRVLSENPLRAKHGARGAASAYMSANALDYPMTLEISLKQQGKGSTRVTFDYQVIHGAYSKGDRQTLSREAEAIIALAAHRATQTSCVVCSADFIADSRFCRQCGAPAASAAPAELEVMRLTSNVRAGHQWTLIGAVILAASTLLPLATLLLMDFAANPKGVKVLLIIAMIVAGLGWWATLAGIRKTHLTLNPRDSEPEDPVLPRPHAFSVPRTNELLMEPDRETLSVTEATTNLLAVHPVSERQPDPVLRGEEKS